MWDETVPFVESTISDSTERDDFDHCKSSDIKYLIYHVTGEKYTFTEEIYNDNAVS